MPYKTQLDISCLLFKDTGGTSRYNLIEFWECPGGQTCCGPSFGCDCITTFLDGDDDPLFLDPGEPDDSPSTFELNDYRLRYDQSSPAIDAGDPAIDNDDWAGYFPKDQFDVDDDGISDGTPYEVTPAIESASSTSDRVLGEAIDLGSYERPCLLQLGCLGDIVDQDTFDPPGDGWVLGADLAFVLSEWGVNPGSPADIVDGNTFLPPPDGVVDGADLGVVLHNWGLCPCDDPYEESMMMGGGSENSGSFEITSGPFEGTYFGLLLEELVATSDAQLAEVVAKMLEEMMEE